MNSRSVEAVCFQQLDSELTSSLLDGAPPHRLVVGYSGGLDSALLLFLLVAYCQKRPWLSLEAVHVNHQMSPNAAQWEAHCIAVCRQCKVPLTVKKVTVVATGKGVEAAAREARYDTFRESCTDEATLLLAHHLDDQVETFFLRLMRGSGPLGLSAMKNTTTYGALNILRPLLTISKQVIEEYATQVGVSWITDESNTSLKYDRNYLRHQILPPLKERWPAMLTSVSRSARLCQDAVLLMDEMAQQDRNSVMCDDGALSVDGIAALSAARARNVLRFCLKSAGILLPSEVVLQRVLDEVIPARKEAHPVVQWKGGAVRRHDGRLYLMLPLKGRENAETSISREQRYRLSACDSQTVMPGVQVFYLPWGGELFVAVNKEDLLAVRSADSFVLPAPLALSLTPQNWDALELTLGQTQITIRPAKRPSKTLKKWWQEYRVPLWYRQCQPLLYCEGELVMVTGLFVNNLDIDGVETPMVEQSETRWISWWPYSLESVAYVD